MKCLLNNERWTLLIKNLQHCGLLFISEMIFFLLYRLILILETSTDSLFCYSFLDLWLCFSGGIKFDMAISMLLVIPLVLLAFLSLIPWINLFYFKIMNTWIVFVSSITILLGGINIFFFLEYKEQFNHWIFGFIYDDRIAIVKTLWQDTPVLMILFCVILFSGVMSFLQIYLIKKMPLLIYRKIENPIMQFFFFVFVGILIIGAARGGFRGRPIQLKDAYVCQNEHLNRCVPNFYKALMGAFQVYYENKNENKLPSFVPGEDIDIAAKILFGEKIIETKDIDQCLEKKVLCSNNKLPKHIFLIVMESYDIWPMLSPGNAFGLTPQLSQIAKEGIFFTNFLSGGGGTMEALNLFFTGLPYNGLMPNYCREAKQPFPTSAATIFKRLGYKTRFYYGGYMSWQRCGDFAKEQGFDEVIGANIISPGKTLGTWGISDKDLFEFLLPFTEASEEPTFNIVLSLSYHRPFDQDIYAEGFKDPVLPDEISKIYNKKSSLNTLGHQWYSDKYLGQFLRAAAERLDDSLFAITGDHWSREFYHSHPLYHEKGVPFVLYGPNFFENKELYGLKKQPGDHLDIIPTIIELVAPKDFIYHAFGESLLNLRKYEYGSGLDHMIVTKKAWFSSNFLDGEQDINIGEEPLTKDELIFFSQRYFAEKSISWWRLIHGSSLDKKDK